LWRENLARSPAFRPQGSAISSALLFRRMAKRVSELSPLISLSMASRTSMRRPGLQRSFVVGKCSTLLYSLIGWFFRVSNGDARVPKQGQN
jgi:hypothetical protein